MNAINVKLDSRLLDMTVSDDQRRNLLDGYRTLQRSYNNYGGSSVATDYDDDVADHTNTFN